MGVLINKGSLNTEDLAEMGFKYIRVGEGNSASWIIYPNDLAEGESLPLAIYQGGDGHNRKLYGNFFNEYNTAVVKGGALPRGIYVSAPNHGTETLEDNAYQTVKTWMDNNNVSVSRIGISPFSGGGDIGTIMAVQAAEDNNDIPVILLSMDATIGGTDGKTFKGDSNDYDNKQFKSFIEEHANGLDNLYFFGAVEEHGQLIKYLASVFPERTYEIIKDGGYDSHPGVREACLKYDILLSLLGLSTKLSNNMDIFEIKGIKSKRTGEFNLDSFLEIFDSNIVTNDEQAVNMAMDNITLCTNRLSSYLQIGGSDPTGVIAFANSKLSAINSLTDDFVQKANEEAAATRTYSTALKETDNDIASQF